MKKYYTVKEAAKAMSVSTNTIYTYLEKGKLVAKRIGKGRYKIPAVEISQYANPVLESPSGSGDSFLKQTVEELSHNHSALEKASSEKGDFAIFQLFTALTLVGLALILLFFQPIYSHISGKEIYAGLSNSLFFTARLMTLFSGALLLVSTFYAERYSKYLNRILIFSIISLFVLSFAYILSQAFGQIVWTGAFLISLIDILIKNLRGELEKVSFSNIFARFSLQLSLLGGLIILNFPDVFPIPFLVGPIKAYRLIFAGIWFGLVVAGLLMVNTFERISLTKFYQIYFSILSIFAFTIGVYLLFQMTWDVSFLSFMASVFGLFAARWKGLNIEIDPKKANYLAFSFVWIASSLILAILTIFLSTNSLKGKASESGQTRAVDLANEANALFERNRAVLVNAMSNDNFSNAITSKSESLSNSEAKILYDKLSFPQRVLVYSSDGEGIGVYPLSPLALGANFFSRDYFQIINNNLIGYITPLFTSVINTPSLMQLEPLIKSNRLEGVVGYGIDLSSLSLKFQNTESLFSDSKVSAIDENGIFVLNSDTEKIGEKAPGQLLDMDSKGPYSETRESILVHSYAKGPRWDIHIEVDKEDIADSTEPLSIVLSLLFLVNSAFSISAGVVSSRKRV